MTNFSFYCGERKIRNHQRGWKNKGRYGQRQGQETVVKTERAGEKKRLKWSRGEREAEIPTRAELPREPMSGGKARPREPVRREPKGEPKGGAKGARRKGKKKKKMN